VSSADDSDADLVVEVRRGSRAAAGILAERYLRGCRATALAIAGDEFAADDICQDAFVLAIERIDDCRDPSRFGAWLRQIVRNRARNHLRDVRTRSGVPLQEVELYAPGPSPAAEAIRADQRDRLLDALSQLPEERREVVLLHDLEGWTHREIADRMELAEGTVRSHLHYARRTLRSLLRDEKEDAS
jgi:RNA polymerase sigma-70 factor (ECF subfamily)